MPPSPGSGALGAGVPAPDSLPARIAYLGPQGTFSEEALTGEADLATAELVPMATIEEAIDAAERGEVDAAFVPIENSIEGSVNVTLDRLVFDAGLLIQREVVLDVHLDLLARAGTSLSAIGRVLSFPVAAAQCRRYLAEHLPGVEVGAVSSTAEAARHVAEAPDVAAAVAPGVSAKLYGLEVLAHAIEDHPGNQTRFVLVAPDVVPPASGHDKTSIVCFQQTNRPGSLHEILGQFAARNLDLTRIESRPTKQALGEYCFVIELGGHLADELVADCLEELHVTLGRLKFLGSYPAYGAESSRVREEIAARRAEARAWLGSLRAKLGPAAPA
ncbi:MAG TPA: prephenate dehydratase [Acidimicrobiales bacterium]|nr:prephenate dehydratase [Acidimicrobiales bacterium]